MIIENLFDFYEATVKMRSYQKQYFSGKKNVLPMAKAAEREIDDYIKACENKAQLTLDFKDKKKNG
ncbi:hypothetical protein AGMMS49940_21890 [Spirochaetia bacterium]|nr:hypothetical protein AGMMS49940_21890 [Spirochaetia bacterium]